jgi:hypothetical protein
MEIIINFYHFISLFVIYFCTLFIVHNFFCIIFIFIFNMYLLFSLLYSFQIGLLSLNPLFLPHYQPGTGSGLGSGSGMGATFKGGSAIEVIEGKSTATATSSSTSKTTSTTTSNTTSNSTPCPAQALLDRLGDTSFDFGVVAVYSCPNSCTVRTPYVSGGGSGSSSSSSSSSKNEGKSSVSSSGTDYKVSTVIGLNPSGMPVPLSTPSYIQYEHVIVQSPPDF